MRVIAPSCQAGRARGGRLLDTAPRAALRAALCAVGTLAHAAAATPFAAPQIQAAPSSAGSLVRVTVALIIVLAAVLAAAWLARRVRAVGGASNPSLEVLAQLPLGTRERAVLMRVGERQLLIGVAPGNVRTLYVFETAMPMSVPSAPTESTDAQRPTFKSLLLRSLGK